MKYESVYPITAAQMSADYRLTVDGLLAFHENTVARYLTTLHLAAFDLQKIDKTWIISEINLMLPGPAPIWTEDIRVTVWISELTPLRVWFEFTAHEMHTGRQVASGNSCWSLISMSSRTLISCEGLTPPTEREDELAAGPHRRRSVLKPSGEAVCSLRHGINRIDLDFNGHTNNRRYISMALICFDEGFLSTHRPDALNIRFLHESRLGDTIRNETLPTADPALFVGQITNSAGQELCRVTSHWTPKEPLEDIAEKNYLR